MQWKMRRLLTAVLCAALAVICLSACGSRDDTVEDGSSSTSAPTTPMPAESNTPAEEAEELWLSILQEGQEMTAAAKRYFRQMGGTGVAVSYPYETFLPDEQTENGLIIRGHLPATGPECGLTVTEYDQPRDAVVQQLTDEHQLTRQEDTVIGTTELPAVHLIGSNTVGEVPLITEYYLVEQQGRSYAVLMYYATEQEAAVRPWLRAMLNTLEFTAQ